MDITGVQGAVDKLNRETIPALVTAINSLVERIDTKLDEDLKNLIDSAHELLDRVNGAQATINFTIPERKTK